MDVPLAKLAKTMTNPTAPSTPVAEADKEETMDLYELHERMTGHLFPAYLSKDERFLALALCGEAGELANFIKKRWRDGADFTEQIRDEIADIRVYLELLAKCFGIEGAKLDQRVSAKLEKVVEKHKSRIWAAVQARKHNADFQAELDGRKAAP